MSQQPQEKQPAPVPAEPSAKLHSYDRTPPPALLDFMLRDWKVPSGKAPPKIRGAQAFLARRRALSKLFPSETLIIPTGHEKVRSNDTYYRFRPGSDFYYLTGNLEPDCVLVMQPKEGGGHRDVLFVEPHPGRSDSTFYTDRNKGELWVGPRLGVEESRIRFGVDECRGLPELGATLGSLRGAATRPWRPARGMSEKADGTLPAQSDRDHPFAQELPEVRVLQDR